MNAEISMVRLLGAAQLLVFAASMLSERLLVSAVGPGDISEKMVSISNNLRLVRTSNLLALINSIGIIVLGVLFYIVFNSQYRIIALLGLVFFLAEGIILAMSKIGSFALLPLSQEFVAAGSPEASHYQTLGDFLYHGVDRRGYDIHMLFFCAGAILWYSLFMISKSIPVALSVWGLAGVCLLTIPTLLVLYDSNFERLMLLGLPYAPFELVLGFWLILKGFT